ncbi:MAG: TonB family protein [Candidatus Eremiobacteraeota bacterium]|nr:TonB family protein [Candidatus Eremiobacteraeota bacterium]
MNKDCARAEILAGAIALGEASETERDDYRRHISACASCLRALGGEREIERVMATVKDAAHSEVWEPVPLRAGERRMRTVRRAWTVGVSTAALAVVASLGIHTLFAANVSAPVMVAARQAQPARVSPFHVTLEHRAPDHIVAKAKPAAPVQQPQPKIVVVHNVITLKQTDRAETKPPVSTTETTVAAEGPAITVPARPKRASSNVPVWRRNEAMPRADDSAVNVARADTAPVLAGHAESIAVAPSYIVRDPAPIGGDTAINPRPASIAYAQGAEGTTAFEVSVDERGNPVKCTITKSSGYLSLDDAVCKAAMKAHYSPRTVNGRATTGIYRDAFTFRALQPQTIDQQPF